MVYWGVRLELYLILELFSYGSKFYKQIHDYFYFIHKTSMINNWKLIDRETRNYIWRIFYENYNFKPSIYPKDWPSIITNLPNIKINISNLFTLPISKERIAKLEDIGLTLFQYITSIGVNMYALDRQHDCFEFNPRLEMDVNAYGERLIPIFPEGDYYIFSTKDLSNIWFGHPWEKTITLIGNEIYIYKDYVIREFNKLDCDIII